ncbi:hypothetical protein [Nocardia sp. NPDC048505]|uniref:hypothetical protein n=1 Tax=unclassified Nocardia TaxID=2637762 RepID=UPI0033ED22B2
MYAKRIRSSDHCGDDTEKYPIVAAWPVTQPNVYTTSVTVIETLNGIYALDTGKKRAALDVAADAVFAPSRQPAGY